MRMTATSSTSSCVIRINWDDWLRHTSIQGTPVIILRLIFRASAYLSRLLTFSSGPRKMPLIERMTYDPHRHPVQRPTHLGLVPAAGLLAGGDTRAVGRAAGGGPGRGAGMSAERRGGAAGTGGGA